MPATVGSIQFITLKGQVQQAGQQVEDVSRVGVDGAAYRKLQKRAEPFQLIGIRNCTDLADAKSKYEALLALQGTVVSVTDDYGATHAKVMILGVQRGATNKLVVASGGVSGGGTGALLVVVFTMQVPEVPA